MRLAFHPFLVNDPFGDPALFIDFLFERRAVMFDLGDIRSLAPRYLLRVSDIFVSHCHMDHFFGFDWLLRIRLGREGDLRLYGPPGFIDQVHAKLSAYTWNLVHKYENDFVITATEVASEFTARSARFPMHLAFRRSEESNFEIRNGLLLDEPGFCVRHAVLDHFTPCLAFAFEERQHVNVWKNCLEEKGLPVGSWLKTLKHAALEGQPPYTQIAVPSGNTLSLGELMACLRISQGMKIAYVTDTVFNAQNARRITDLAQGATRFFIEAPFAHELADRAREKYHLTSAQAGWLARHANAQSVTPFHHSPLYHGREALLQEEVQKHFENDMPLNPS